MQQVINGKLFDSDTAEYICGYSYGNVGDFKHLEESLYKSPNGQFFLEFTGGPLTQYAKHYGQNEVGGSSGIRLVTEEEAREFVEEHGDVSDYADAFAEVPAG